MAERAARAEVSLSKTCKRLGITPEGKAWLDLALDPFKDLNMPTNGFPDDVEIPSVVETIHESFVVSVPASVAAGNNWDANIFVDQLYTSIPVFGTSTGAWNVYAASGQFANGSRGGLIVRSGPANSSLIQNTTTAAVSLKSDILTNAEVRLIGIGLEIHNTTQELKKQGAIICYRLPAAIDSNDVATMVYDFGTTACIPCTLNKVRLTSPPLTASEAIDFPSSIQWEAKDGAYVVPVLTEPIIPVREARALFCVGSDGAGGYVAPFISQAGAAKLMFSDPQNVMSPFSLSGCFLSGLSYETTLQVNLTYYVEAFPDKSNTLRRLAKPSPSSDAAAMALYGHIVENLPVGCQVSDNFIGAFMAGVSRIAQTAMRVLPQVGRAIATGVHIAESVAGGFQGMDMERSNSPMSMVVHNPSNRVQNTAPRQEMVVLNPTRNLERQIVRYETPNNRQRQQQNSGVEQNNGVSQNRSQRSKKKHRNALAEAANMPTRNGNKWIEQYQKK